jgi:hypothetical protein
MAQYADLTQLDGLFKEIYADNLENLIPEEAILTRMIKYSEREQIGDGFHQPVVLAQEGGVTYAASGSSAFALNSSVAMTMKDAVVDGYQMLLRSSIPYESAAKASGSKRAFVRTTELIIKNMLETITKRLEICLLYGQSGIGQTTTGTNAGGTSFKCTITAASWATGIWSGLENSIVNFYESGSSNQVSGSNGQFTVSIVDVTNKQVTFTGTNADIIELDSVLNGSGQTLDIYFHGAKSNEAAGLQAIISNTGTLFGINAANYQLWKGSTYSYAGAITVAKFYEALGAATARGLNKKAVAVLNPEIWTDFMALLANSRRYDGSYKRTKGDYGFEALELIGSNGVVTVIPHQYCKIGDGFLFCADDAKRIGATDVTFKNPGTGNKFFRELNDNAGYELRTYSHQALFIEKPAVTVYGSGLTT